MQKIKFGCNNDTYSKKALIEIYYSFFYPHLLYGIEFWGHASENDLKRVIVLQNTCVRVILKKKTRDHVSTLSKTLNIMPLNMLFQYCSLKLFSRTFSNEFINSLKSDDDYNKRLNNLQTKKAKNKRGGRSLLCHGVNLYNRYLMGVETCTQSGSFGGLAVRLWEGV